MASDPAITLQTAGQGQDLMFAKWVFNSRNKITKKCHTQQSSSLDSHKVYRKQLPSDTFGW